MRRHLVGTELMENGVPGRVIAEMFAHDSVTIAQDIYAHVLPHMQQAVDIIEQRFHTTQPDATCEICEKPNSEAAP